MTVQNKKLSKNRRRKNRRYTYYKTIEDLNRDPDNMECRQAFCELMENYCAEIDQWIDSTVDTQELANCAEWMIIRRLLAQVDGNDWVAVHTKDGVVQIKADINDYIDWRKNTTPLQSRLRIYVAEYLHERAIQHIRPRRRRVGRNC